MYAIKHTPTDILSSSVCAVDCLEWLTDRYLDDKQFNSVSGAYEPERCRCFVNTSLRLTPVTLKLKRDRDILKMYPHTQQLKLKAFKTWIEEDKNMSRSKCQKLRHTLSVIETDIPIKPQQLPTSSFCHQCYRCIAAMSTTLILDSWPWNCTATYIFWRCVSELKWVSTGLTSNSTLYRSFRGRFLRPDDPTNSVKAHWRKTVGHWDKLQSHQNHSTVLQYELG